MPSDDMAFIRDQACLRTALKLQPLPARVREDQKEDTMVLERRESRLIVAADFKPDPEKGQDRGWVREQVLQLADDLHGLGVTLKVNSALRACGYHLMTEIQDRSLEVFADLKLVDIDETLILDGALLDAARPKIVTAMADAGPKALTALRHQMLSAKLIAVTVLTTMTEADTMAKYGCPIPEAVVRLAKYVKGSVDGYVCSAKEIAVLRAAVGEGAEIVAPAIRPACLPVKGDDQNPARIVTAKQALRLGADYIVVGRPITQHADRRAATMMTLEEMFS